MGLLRVVTLNLWNRQGPWPARLTLVQSGLDAIAPDVVALQEVLSKDGASQADEIARGLRGAWHVAFGAAHAWADGTLFGNAILSRWPIARTEVVPLPAGGTKEARSLLRADLATPFGELPVFVTHLNWKLHEGLVREQQVVAVAEAVKRAAPIAGLPPVLCGDLNAQPETNEIRFLSGLGSLAGRSVYFADCFGLVGAGPGVTFDTRHNGFAAPTLEPPRRIDYVFVRGPDRHGRGRPVTSRVVLDAPSGNVWPSDHYGVLAEISF